MQSDVLGVNNQIIGYYQAGLIDPMMQFCKCYYAQ